MKTDVSCQRGDRTRRDGEQKRPHLAHDAGCKRGAPPPGTGTRRSLPPEARIIPVMSHEPGTAGHPSGDVYHSEQLADAYATSRPAVHPRVADIVATRLRIDCGSAVPRALDVGCGAGLSTAALLPLARTVVGVDPSGAMVRRGGRVAPGARFAVARAEALPFCDERFDLVTAAGALNYADRRRALPEIRRVLAPRGTLVVYDFSGGRRTRPPSALGAWFDGFEDHYPYPGGYAMDVRALDYAAAGLRLAAIDPFTIVLSLDFDAFLQYVLSETNVEQAVRQGAPRQFIEAWCRDTLRPLFASGPLDVEFDGYVALISRQNQKEIA